MSSQSSQPFVHSGQPLNEFLQSFWQRQIHTAEEETPDYRHPALPLARIKKVMKSDPDVKMIAADGLAPSASPILFCKACEIFIAEITARAFIIADSNKRRTLSRSDIAQALSKSDQFDFLIDVVPREDYTSPRPGGSGIRKTGSGGEIPKSDQATSEVSSQLPLNMGNLDNAEASNGIDQFESLLQPPTH
ncbi:Transcriptional activator hap5 [Paramarasmius palmivorus]|uniref:Transcriptional activator hap5 n=1 Tax=Paramarasmius palmivorus TaxID=297713 RepID=A0AAW0C0C7_9AGAR